MHPDVFKSNAFKLTTLTAAINKLPYTPTRISQLGWFAEMGVPTLDVWIEEQSGVVSVLPVQARGTAGKAETLERRKGRSFRIPHIPRTVSVMADEVLGVRAFGTENNMRTVESIRDQKLAQARRNIDYTMEAHRVKAVKGVFVDANGDDVSLFTEFGVQQQTKALGLHATNRSQIRGKMFEVAEQVESALGGNPYSGIRVLCGSTFWAALLEDKDTRDTYLNQVQAAELRGNPLDSFAAFGATWERYRGTSDVNFGSDAYAVPEGVPDLFLTRFAPADTMAAVGTVGLPYYAIPEMLDFDAGMEIKVQSNPLNICTRPAAIIKLTIS